MAAPSGEVQFGAYGSTRRRSSKLSFAPNLAISLPAGPRHASPFSLSSGSPYGDTALRAGEKGASRSEPVGTAAGKPPLRPHWLLLLLASYLSLCVAWCIKLSSALLERVLNLPFFGVHNRLVASPTAPLAPSLAPAS